MESIPKIETGAAQIVSAARTPSYFYPPTTYAGGAAPGTFGVTGGVSGEGSPLVWIVAAVGLVVLLLSRK